MDDMTFSDLKHTHTHTHTDKEIGYTKTNRLTHTYKYISELPAMCTKQLPALH